MQAHGFWFTNGSGFTRTARKEKTNIQYCLREDQKEPEQVFNLEPEQVYFLTHQVHWTKVITDKSANNSARKKPLRAAGTRESAEHPCSTAVERKSVVYSFQTYPSSSSSLSHRTPDQKKKKYSTFHILCESYTLECNRDTNWPIQPRSIE